MYVKKILLKIFWLIAVLAMCNFSRASENNSDVKLRLSKYDSGFDVYLVNDGVKDIYINPDIRAYGGGAEVKWEFYRGAEICKACNFDGGGISPYRGPSRKSSILLQPQQLIGARLPLSRLVHDYNIPRGCYKVRAVYSHTSNSKNVFGGEVKSNFVDFCRR